MRIVTVVCLPDFAVFEFLSFCAQLAVCGGARFSTKNGDLLHVFVVQVVSLQVWHLHRTQPVFSAKFPIYFSHEKMCFTRCNWTDYALMYYIALPHAESLARGVHLVRMSLHM